MTPVAQLAPPPTLERMLLQHLATQFEEEAQRPVVTAHETDAVEAIERNWRRWLTTLFGRHVAAGFAPHQVDFWNWLWSIESGVKPSAFIAVWPRGGAKSTTAELATVVLGARSVRRYGLYVSETQDQADDHVQNVAMLLEAIDFAAYYPLLSRPLVGKFGNIRGWRRNRLRTASGFTIDAIGLDVASRGAKLEDARPDWMVFDDIDKETDSVLTVARKVKLLTNALLPAGSPDLAVLGIQNLIHPNSIFAQLADGRAEFLTNKILSGPIPALRNAVYEQRDGRWTIAEGEPTWEGQNFERCQDAIDEWGLTSFRTEGQHEVEDPPGGMFNHLSHRHCGWDEIPDLRRVVVWCDPAVTDTDQSDSYGIQADGITSDGTIYRLWSWEDRTSPEDALTRAILKAIELGAESVGVETDQGGDAWRPAYRDAVRSLQEDARVPAGARIPAFKAAKAGQGHGSKVHRASQMLADYERGRFVHVIGTHDALERGLARFPKKKPFDLVDAAFWSWADLTGRLETASHAPTVAPVIIGVGGGNLFPGEGRRR